MLSSGRRLLGRARVRVCDDLRTDPYLKYILVLAFVLGGFWLWYGVPNFSNSDEFTRLIDPLVSIANVATDPSLGSFRAGVAHGRTLGATFYLYGLVLVPSVAVLLAHGRLGLLASLHELPSRWVLWHAVPMWFWTTNILLARFVNLLFAVGCVYLVYRFGTAMRDRTTGRLAAVLLVVCYGFLTATHEFGEDVPALFLLLLVLYLGLRYVRTGAWWYFLAGCAFGGLAIAMKLTAGATVFVLAGAYLLRARNVRNPRDALVVPRLLGLGALLGVAAMLVGFPSVLTAGPSVISERLLATTARKTSTASIYASASPIWRWLGSQYLRGLGGPLLLAAGIGGLVSLRRVRERSPEGDGTVLVLVALAVYGLVFSQWQYVRVHHLLPTFPLLVILVATALSRLVDSRPRVARPLIALLLVTSGVFAAAGTLQYATYPEDDATGWIATELPQNATMEVYEDSITTVAVPHSMNVSHYETRGVDAFERTAPLKNESAYTDWVVNGSERNPAYIYLTGEQLTYLNPNGTNAQNYPDRAAYFREVVNGDEYTTVAKFEPSSMLDSITSAFSSRPPSGFSTRIVILERTDRCPASPTCPANATGG